MQIINQKTSALLMRVSTLIQDECSKYGLITPVDQDNVMQYLHQDGKFYHSPQWWWYGPSIGNCNLEEQCMEESVTDIEEWIGRIVVIVISCILCLSIRIVLLLLSTTIVTVCPCLW